MTEDKIDRLLELKRTRALSLTPEKTALLVVDMQEYQVRRGFAVYDAMDHLVPGMLDYYVDRVVEVAEPNIKRLIEACHQSSARVVYTKYSSFNSDGSDLPAHIREMNRGVKAKFGDVLFPPVDHPGSEILESIKPSPQDLVVVKNTSSVFASTRLEFILKNMGVEQLLVCGVVTNMCVENAARTASDIGFDTIIVEDASAAWSPETHAASLRSFEMVFGRVANTGQVVTALTETKS